MAVDAPTVNRHSLLLGLVVALSSGWTIRIGDIRAAFLNGVQSSGRLFFRQPARGIPGLRPGQLVEILKGVFGLATSPKLWWLKLSTDLLQKTSATTKTNNMAGTMVNMTNGVNTVNPSNMTTMTHSPIKSFSMRHSPPPRPVRLIPTILKISKMIPKTRRSPLALPTSLGTLKSQADQKIRNLIVLTVAINFKRVKSTSQTWNPLMKWICLR